MIAAKVYGKDPEWIRAGIISGWLPIGMLKGKKGVYCDLYRLWHRVQL